MKETLEILLSRDQIAGRVGELAEQISADYRTKRLVLVCILKGAVIFLSDLMRMMPLPVEIDFMAVSSYGQSTSSSGVVRILKDLDRNIGGKDVLVVEDIIDTGLTLNYLYKNILQRRPRSLKVVTLLDKPERRQVSFKPDYFGFSIPDHFVVGYGLDFNERYRHLPDICILKGLPGAR
ncbi:MAG TPA: hypoxanthine phosphoribosyltransferase [Firmicutes bacterium]|nr:hypoxanthine phosphoribosyltransferase [Bacillota bacterium]